MVLECNIDLSVRLDISFPEILLTKFEFKEKKDSEAPLGFSVCFDVPSDRIGVLLVLSKRTKNYPGNSCSVLGKNRNLGFEKMWFFLHHNIFMGS